MSEPKFSVGQEVDYGDARGPATVVAVHVQGYLYDLQWGSRGGLVTGYRECDLRPHVPKLEVGDRVRHTYCGIEGVIDSIRGPFASVWDGDQWSTWAANDLIRIPTEARQMTREHIREVIEGLDQQARGVTAGNSSLATNNPNAAAGNDGGDLRRRCRGARRPRPRAKGGAVVKCNECGNVGPCPQCEPEKFAGCAGETMPREVADRLAEACDTPHLLSLLQHIGSGSCTCDYEVGAAPCEKCVADVAASRITAAIADYRKAVAGG